MNLRRCVCSGVVFGVFVACASGSAVPDAGSAPDAPGDAASTRDAAVDAAPAPRARAVIMLERWARVDPPTAHTIAAVLSFNADEAQPHLLPVDAHCSYHEDLAWAPSAPRPRPGYGTFLVTMPKLGEATFTEDTGYEPPGGVLGWDTGDTLKVATTGGEVPPFALEDTVPPQATLTSHDLTTLRAGDLVVPRSAPLALTWTPVATEVFALFLQFDSAANPHRGIMCFYPGASGSAAIPTAALGHLRDSKSVAFSNFYFSGASRKQVSSGRVDVEMVTWKGQSVRIRVE